MLFFFVIIRFKVAKKRFSSQSSIQIGDELIMKNIVTNLIAKIGDHITDDIVEHFLEYFFEACKENIAVHVSKEKALEGINDQKIKYDADIITGKLIKEMNSSFRLV